MTESRLAVTVFTDFASPHCYVTERALRALAGAGEMEMEIVYRAVEMYPAGVALPEPSEIERVAADARGHAGEAGIVIGTPRSGVRTRKAHEAARFAAEHAAGDAFRDAVFAAYWTAGDDIGRIDVLAGIAAEVGLDPEEMRIALDIDRFGEAVLHDAEVARRLRIRHVPTIYLGTGPRARILVGLQTAADLDAAARSR